MAPGGHPCAQAHGAGESHPCPSCVTLKLPWSRARAGRDRLPLAGRVGMRTLCPCASASPQVSLWEAQVWLVIPGRGHMATPDGQLN